ncbi:hypothetical protein [Paraburkholderia sp. J8-2]|uniref:hypothetical protein n=1 Tax=Paraburkholderia sp. J8-2 TaxID=2805440 RepID=UPI002AB6496D|nr:hypothetical protein [Paraburkholderia sp. J8-2]
MKKHLATLAAAISFCSLAHAAPAVPNYELFVALSHDGATLTTARSIIRDSFGNVVPLHVSSGTSVGYGECAKTANGQSVTSHQKFVGHLVQVVPTKIDGTAFDLSVTAADTLATGITNEGPADCVRQVVHTKGLDVHDIVVHMNAGDTTEVPIGDAHYKLVLKLVAE